MGYCTLLGFGLRGASRKFDGWAIEHLISTVATVPQRGTLSRRAWLLGWAVTTKIPSHIPEPTSGTYDGLIAWAKANFAMAEA